MPLVNIYGREAASKAITRLFPELKEYLAKKLTCGDIELSPEEISIRVPKLIESDMIASVEVEITAHSFPERVEKQDEICLDVMKWLQGKTGLEDIKVWLKLLELGHSWEQEANGNGQ